MSTDGVAHRFVRGGVSVDLVAPDGVGQRADLTTVAGGVTVEVGGGTFALQRYRPVAVRTGERTGEIPLPDLAGAILIKAVAATHDRKRGPERHLRDLAFLLSLVVDPFQIRDTLAPRNCRRVTAVDPLGDPDHEAWMLIDDPRARAEGQATFRFLWGGPDSSD